MTHKLKADSLSFFEALVMGIAGAAPGFSIAVTLATLIGTAGVLAPGAILIFAVPMIGIALAYKGLNARMPNAGAGYEWTGRIFNRSFGFFSGWAVLVASTVFMVTGAVPLGSATLSFFPDPALATNVMATTLVGAMWFVAIALVLVGGITLSSKLQLIMSGIEMLLLTIVVGAAFWHAWNVGPVNAFSWGWFSFGYSPQSFASSALIVVFFYWGWDVAANLGEETKSAERAAGNGGLLGVVVMAVYFLAYVIAALFLFSLKDITSFSDNLVYHLAVAAGLGKVGGAAASIAVILSSVATLETQMLQFSRTLFAMGRDGALPRKFGFVHPRTLTPARAIYLLLGLGLVMTYLSSFIPTVALILGDSVKAIALQVCLYYGLAGLASAWAFRNRGAPITFLTYCVFPGLSALALFGLGAYALSTFDLLTRIVGVGGLLLGLVFWRPKGYRALV